MSLLTYYFCFQCRKRKLHGTMTASQRTEIIKMKAQMEQQIQALKQQIYLEQRALIARSNNRQQLAKDVRYERLVFLANISPF